MAHRKEQGSIIGFVLVGVLLTALLAGSIYAVKSGMLKGSGSTVGDVASNDTKTASDDNTNENKTDTPPSTTTNNNSNDLKKALEEQAAAEKKAEEQRKATEAESKAASSPATTIAPSSASLSTTTNLPHTGPAEDAMVAILGVSLLAGTSYAFIRSRALI